ncbi:MAG: cytochrome c [Pseudomonadota bacterium]
MMRDRMKALLPVVVISMMPLMTAQAFQGNPDQGREIFMQRCSMCHGADGRGNNGMAVDFREEWYRLTKSDDELMQSLRNGISTPGRNYSAGMMPPQMLNKREMYDVLNYLRSAFMQ